MARFVMISIPDNAEADAFVAAMREGYIMYSTPHPKLEGEVGIRKPTTEWTAVAVWADPTKLCECHKSWERPNPIAKAGQSGLRCEPVKSQNYGWLVCSLCRKPHGFQVQHPRNLLVENERPETRPYYLGFRADRGKNDGTA
jgi:hypothetical protein